MKKYILFLFFITGLNAIDSIYTMNRSAQLVFFNHLLYFLSPGYEIDASSPIKLPVYSKKNGEPGQDITNGVINFHYSLLYVKGALIYSLTNFTGNMMSSQQRCTNYHLMDCFMYQQILHPTRYDYEYINKEFRKVFNKDLVTKIEYYDPLGAMKRIKLVHYNSSALKTAFEKIYQNPKNKIWDYMFQDIYDTLFKDFFRDQVTKTSKLLADKNQFNLAINDYRVKMEKENFNAREYLAIMDSYYDYNLKDDRLEGFIIRRAIDGSLGTILDIFNQIMKDYDSDFYKSKIFDKISEDDFRYLQL